MKKVEIHPVSVTVGAIVAALLLFACSSSRVPTTLSPAPTPSVSTQVTFYSEADPILGPNPPQFGATYVIGSTSAPTVITEVSATQGTGSFRLVVNGVPVFAWSPSGDQRFVSFVNGIRVPSGALLTIESSSGSSDQVWSLAGYTL